ncbi:MAG: DUF6569 family protein [Planctomycetota bacterium]
MRRIRAPGVLCVVLSATVLCWAGDSPAEQGASIQVGECRVSGPYTCDNLAVFLVHGDDTGSADKFLTMDEALKKKQLIIRETDQVKELRAANLSRDRYIYLQSGEIVKGGKQDRTLRYDYIIRPAAAGVRLQVFCVERARWNQRGGEPGHVFTAGHYLNTRELRLAAKLDGSQSRVWRQVRRTQARMGQALNASVRAARSPSSLQLTLENRALARVGGRHARMLRKALKGKKDVLGFAFGINGNLVGGDVYNSNALFRKMAPKLFAACVSEAITKTVGDPPRVRRLWSKEKQELVTVVQEPPRTSPPSLQDARSFLLDVRDGKKAETEISEDLTLVIRRTDKAVLFTLDHPDQGILGMHDSYSAVESTATKTDAGDE